MSVLSYVLCCFLQGPGAHAGAVGGVCWAVCLSYRPWEGFLEEVISRLRPKSRQDCVQTLEVLWRLPGPGGSMVMEPGDRVVRRKGPRAPPRELGHSQPPTLDHFKGTGRDTEHP